ncbi:MAG: c-type cytochrome [Prevotellaceae bacterium]|jgi:DNA-binding beta-propeller fold protein YncE/mono/diheme cytochrome c family protein|nr:c-type cytochrome [Prevotellaceae bacterium]
MKSIIGHCFFWINIVFLCGCSQQQIPIGNPSGILIFDEGKQMVAASDKESCLVFFELPLTSGTKWKSVNLPGKPSGIVASHDGKTIWATCGEESGKLLAIDPASASVIKTFAAGHYPLSPVLSADGKRLFFCRRFANEIASINLPQNDIVCSIPVKSEPIALAIVPGQPILLAAHHRPVGSSVADIVASSISVINTDNQTVVKEIQLPNGSTSVRRITLSPDGKYAYIPHTIGRYQIPTTQLERGWMNTNALSIVDIDKQTLLNTVLLDDLDLGAANPWDAAVTNDLVIVSHAGTHELSVIDRNLLHRKLDEVNEGTLIAASPTADAIPDDLTFLLDCRTRIPLKGNGPRSISIADRQVVVACYFSHSLETVYLDNNRISSILVKTDYPQNKAERGEMLFHDAHLCFQHWQSCASCHPDARADGLNWDLVNDGIGNPKNTKSLLFAHVTPPAMITGIRPDAEYAVRSGIRHIQFVDRPEEDAVCIDKYLKSLRPIESPRLIEGRQSDAARRGKVVFETAGCAQCHNGKYYTDKRLYEVGATENYPEDQKFDTPTLREIWRTAPYLYDGRASTLDEMTGIHNSGNKHGNTSHLNKEQLNDLSEYILSL